MDFNRLFKDGNEYLDNKDYSNSLICYDKFLRNYLKKDEKLAIVLYNKGIIYLKTEKYLNAISCFKESINIFNDLIDYDKRFLGNNYYNISYCYAQEKNIYMAYKYIMMSKKYLNNDKNINLIIKKFKKLLVNKETF